MVVIFAYLMGENKREKEQSGTEAKQAETVNHGECSNETN